MRAWAIRHLVVCAALVVSAATLGACTDDRDDAEAPTPDVTVEPVALGDPWTLHVVDADGNAVLTSPSVGAIAITTDSGTFTSGEVRAVDTDGEATLMTVTSEPDGPDLSVIVGIGDAGEPAVSIDGGDEAETVALTFAARNDERYLGTGARATGVDHRGQEVHNRVLDGPYTENQIPIVEALIPPAGFDPRPDSTYYPMPWVLSTAGYGVLVGDDEDSHFEFATPDAPDRWSVEVDARHLGVSVFGGPTPADALAAMTEVVGRQPKPPAPYVLGPWWQPTGGIEEDDVTQLARLHDAGVPVSVAQTYLHYLPCGDHEGEREETRAHTEAMHQAGVAVTAYVNPMVCVEYSALYDQGVDTGAFTKDATGAPYVYPYFTSTMFEVVQFDFTAAAGIELFESVLDLVVEDGYDGWMEDFGEYTPDDAVSEDGTPGTAMHNRYVDLYHAAAARYAEQAPRPLARYTRSGWRNSASVSPIVWGGDPTTTWGFDGLESTLWSGLGMGLSGVSTWGSDIGGFFSFTGEELTPELLQRWIELGAFSGVMRLQANGISVGVGPRTPIFDDEVLPIWKRYSQLRTRLYPYIAGATEQYRSTGLPIMRHHVLTHPDDSEAYARDDQYLFGADLLVAPALGPGMTEREVYLPDGEWVDVWRSLEFDDAGDATIGYARILNGPGTVTLATPMGYVPLLLRAGAVLPLLPSDVTTLAEYGEGEPGIVRLADRDDVRELLAFPGPDWSGPLGPGESMRSRVGKDGTWTLEFDATAPRSYTVQAAFAAVDAAFSPCSVSVDGEELDTDTNWDADTRVLVFEVQLDRDATLTVEAC